MNNKKFLIVEYLHSAKNERYAPLVQCVADGEGSADDAISAVLACASQLKDSVSNAETEPALQIAENGDDTLPYDYVLRLWDGDDYRIVAGWEIIFYTNDDVEDNEDSLYDAVNAALYKKLFAEVEEYERSFRTREDVLNHVFYICKARDFEFALSNESIETAAAINLLKKEEVLPLLLKAVDRVDCSDYNDMLLQICEEITRH